MKRLLTSLLLICCAMSVGPAAASQATSTTAVDNRIPIAVTAEERNQVLFEMRSYLQGMYNIFNALARGDMKAVAVEAIPLGRLLDRMPPAMRERMPLAYVEMGRGLHEVFDAIARDAGSKPDPSRTLSQLAEAMTYCSGCHDTYRLQVGRVQRVK